MESLHVALRSYRKTATALRLYPREPVPAVIVACSESHRANAFLSSIEPVYVVQSLGGLTGPRDESHIEESARSAIEYATEAGGVRHVVICGHFGCSFQSRAADRGGAGSQSRVLRQVRMLLEDAALGPRFRSGELTVRALWFDDDEGDIFLYDPVERRFELLGDGGVEALVQSMQP